MISTSCISGTGFMKCMPMTRSARLVPAASLVIEIELVLLARMVSGGQQRSSSASTDDLTGSFSTTASTTSWQGASAESSLLVRTRESVASLSAAVSLPLAMRRSRLLPMPAMPRSSAAGATSTMVTARPACAATCAMPCPIVPAPTTPMLLTACIEGDTIRRAREGK